MKKNRLIFRILGALVFAAGFLAGAGLFVASTWADVEAAQYGFARYGKAPTSALRCPMLVTGTGYGAATFLYENTSDRSIRPSVRFQASGLASFDEENYRLELAPGQSQQVRMELDAGNIVLGNYIFVKVFTFASYPLRDVEQTCGMLYLDLPQVSGAAVVAVGMIASLAGMAFGLATWSLANRPIRGRAADARRAMVVMGLAVLFGFASALLGWWMLGVVLSVLTILLAGVVIGNALLGRS